VQHRRDLQVGTQQPGQQAEQEKQDHGFKRHGTPLNLDGAHYSSRNH
jgi:hypothetical protein